MSSRRLDTGDREAAAAAREAAVSKREELARLRDEALMAHEEADVAHRERELLLAQMREANQNLLLAALRANELSDEADAARAAMAASEERFRSLVTTSAAILFQADGNGRISIDPGSWRRLTGLSAAAEEEDEPGWGWLHAVPPDDQERVRLAWTQAVATRQLYSCEHRLRKPDGSYIWVVARAVPLPGAGRVREWVGTMTDVSDRVRIEEAREQFIAVLGHDLRNPLSAIMVSAELLASHDLDDLQMRTVARLRKSAQRMEALIRDILDFARGRLGRGIPIARKPCDLGTICADAIAEVKQAHPDRSITCQTIGDTRGEWDADRLEQVLSNLIGNAIEQGSDPIQVTTRDDGDVVILSVHNGGNPIPPGLLRTLFEPFQRRIGDRGRGLGLGLYIVNQIARAHGATMAVTSSHAAGTTFTIPLPRRQPAAEEKAEPALPVPVVTTGDDPTAEGSTLAQIGVGFQVIVSGAGQEIGEVREVLPAQLVISVNDVGEVVVPASAVIAVHYEKIVIDSARLDDAPRQAIGRIIREA